MSAHISEEIVIHADSGEVVRSDVAMGMGAVGATAEKRKELHFSMFSNIREIFDLIEQLIKTAITE